MLFKINVNKKYALFIIGETLDPKQNKKDRNPDTMRLEDNLTPIMNRSLNIKHFLDAKKDEQEIEFSLNEALSEKLLTKFA